MVRRLISMTGLLLCVAQAHAAATLLVEDPFGRFGSMNPTGHAAIYLNHVCAESLTRLRMCRPGEAGVVLSRYHHVAGYDWLAVPVMEYLYAVERADEVPERVTPELEAELRDAYRRRHLEEIAPDLPDGSAPGGEWIQLAGAAYDRRIHGFRVETTLAADRRLVRWMNARRNVSHFNLFFNNCADLSRGVLNFYYPHAVGRSFVADFGFTTPKHLAKAVTKTGRRRPEMELTAFVIDQVPGTVERSRPTKGVAESLLKSKKYVAPLAYFYPEFTGGMAVFYLTAGRYTFPVDVPVMDQHDFEGRTPAADLARSRETAMRDAGSGRVAEGGTDNDPTWLFAKPVETFTKP